MGVLPDVGSFRLYMDLWVTPPSQALLRDMFLQNCVMNPFMGSLRRDHVEIGDMSEQLDRLSLGKVRDVGQKVRHVDGEVVVDVIEADDSDKLVRLTRIISSDLIASEADVGEGPKEDVLASYAPGYSGRRVLDNLGHMDVEIVFHVEYRARRLGDVEEAGAVRHDEDWYGGGGSEIGGARRLMLKENCVSLGNATHTYAHLISDMFTFFLFVI